MPLCLLGNSAAAPGAAIAGDADGAAEDGRLPGGTGGGVEAGLGAERVAAARYEAGKEPAEAPEPTTATPVLEELKAGSNDPPSRMAGDVNLFLHHTVACSSGADDNAGAPTSVPIPPPATAPDSSLARQRRQRRKIMHKVTGEVDIMIASPQHRCRGLGKAAVCAFLNYVSRSRRGILAEYFRYRSRCEDPYHAGDKKREIVGGGREGRSGKNTDLTNHADDDENNDEEAEAELTELVAKIHATNTASQALFKSLGFEKRGDVNYFGELEMVRNDVSRTGLESLGSGVYKEVKYVRS